MSYKLTARKRRDLLKQKTALENSIKESRKTLAKLRKKKDDATAAAIANALEVAIRYSEKSN